MPSISQSDTSNILLKTMTRGDFASLGPSLERVSLQRGMCLAPTGVTPEHAYFLEGGVASIVTFTEGGRQAEVGLFGREGMSSSSLLLGVDHSPFGTFIQIEGATALRISTNDFTAAVENSESLAGHLRPFVHCLASQVSYTASSNATDNLQQRLARWLLMCHDRVEGNELGLTHRFLGMMLAVRRAGVTNALAEMQEGGSIHCQRSMITVLGREALETCAGSSYGVPESEYRRLFPMN